MIVGIGKELGTKNDQARSAPTCVARDWKDGGSQHLPPPIQNLQKNLSFSVEFFCFSVPAVLIPWSPANQIQCHVHFYLNLLPASITTVPPSPLCFCLLSHDIQCGLPFYSIPKLRTSIAIFAVITSASTIFACAHNKDASLVGICGPTQIFPNATTLAGQGIFRVNGIGKRVGVLRD